ncbi:DUF6634 family protein [Bosea sp. (in: a-proteobacteria)]|uniref:DUF6634 family protein n=1 Tax=Bosea sp. (in: a-proteobacteria) TaxID=1871050 RepID=UPI002B4A1897|nr:DUF6634 family protein [Bosea sp. (in: a-proteobacteria)]WRH57242.1 MAG: DUF6634 family protein [Bosea sp. (in: a-proteobacteria)]
MPTLPEKIRAAYRDLDLLRSGWRPDASIEAVQLDDWFPVVHRGLDLPALAGEADHPRLGQTLITTSPVLWISDDQGLARCLSRWYRLGQPRRVTQQVPVCGWDDIQGLETRVAGTGRTW